MVIVDPNYPWYPDTYPYPDTNPFYPIYPDPNPYPHPMEWTHPKKAEARHVKDVKKGIMIEFEDGTWMFIATDDECYEKIKKAVNDE